jgi:hypothetical protein
MLNADQLRQIIKNGMARDRWKDGHAAHLHTEPGIRVNGYGTWRFISVQELQTSEEFKELREGVKT